MSGAAVAWAVTAGGGSLSSSSSTTDGSGQASAAWTLGKTAGTGSVTATVGSLAPVTFGATAKGGAAATIKLSADSISLEAGKTQQVSTEIKDQFGNVVTPRVAWTTSDSAVVVADSTGLLHVRKARKATVTATADGASARAVVVVRPGPPDKQLVHAGNNQTALAATVVKDVIAVKVIDAFENGVPNVSINWAVQAGSGSIDPTTSTTDTSGIATTRWTLGRHAGTNTLSATVSGSVGTPLTLQARATPNGTISGSVSLSGDLMGYSLAGPAASGSSPSRASGVATKESGRGLLIGDAPSEVRSSASRAAPAATSLIVTYRSAALGVAPQEARMMRSAARAREVGREIGDRLQGPARTHGLRISGVSPAVLSARVEVGDPAQLEAARAALLREPGVASVEVDTWVYPIEDVPLAAAASTPGRRIPADPGYPAQAWHYGMLDLPQAWNLTTGSQNVIVAVVDDGIRFDHPAVAANLTSDGYDFVRNDLWRVCGTLLGNAGDGNGPDSDPTTPVDYDCSTRAPATAGGHGLHVAGTIGAVGNDATPLTGVNWSVRIRPVRVLGLGGGSNYDIAQGILYAAGLPADNGAGGVVQASSRAHVINLSLGGESPSVVTENAVKAATSAGSLLIAAAGNSATSRPFYPAAYPEVLSVSSVTPYSRLASYSNYGPTVDIAGPGGETGFGSSYGIASTVWNFATGRPAYTYYQGTSMAAPHVSGVAALILAKEPSLTAAELRNRLVDYAVDLGPAGRDDQFGAGLVNARNSLTRSHAPRRSIYVQLYDARTGAIVKTVAAPGGAFRFTELPDGDYHVFAGVDEEGDQKIGVPGRLWGALTTGGKAAVVKVDGAGNYAASFTAAFPNEAEPNNTSTGANRLVVGGYVHATLGSGTDVDVFQITLPGGEYTFETSGWSETACGYAYAADTVLDLRGSDGTLLASNDDVDVSRFNYCSRITRTLQAGTYYLHVRGTGQAYRLEARSGS